MSMRTLVNRCSARRARLQDELDCVLDGFGTNLQGSEDRIVVLGGRTSAEGPEAGVLKFIARTRYVPTTRVMPPVHACSWGCIGLVGSFGHLSHRPRSAFDRPDEQALFNKANAVDLEVGEGCPTTGDFQFPVTKSIVQDKLSTVTEE